MLDESGKVAENYSVYGIPLSILIDKRNEVVFQFLGNLNWELEKMTALVQSLLEEQAQPILHSRLYRDRFCMDLPQWLDVKAHDNLSAGFYSAQPAGGNG